MKIKSTLLIIKIRISIISIKFLRSVQTKEEELKANLKKEEQINFKRNL